MPFIFSSRSSGYLVSSSVGSSLSVSLPQLLVSTGISFFGFLQTEPIVEEDEAEEVEAAGAVDDDEEVAGPLIPEELRELSVSISSSSKLAPPRRR